MKVLIVATSRKTRGGITSVLKAYKSHVFWGKYNCKWIETHRDGGYFRKILYFVSSLFQYIILLPFYDIVHIHFSVSLSAKRKYIFFLIAKLYGKRIITHLHCGSQLDGIWNNIFEQMIVRADKCLVLSNSIKDCIIKRVGNCDNIEVLYNPCPHVLLDNSLKEKRLLFAGTLYKEKGFLDLIKAFGLLNHEFDDWKLVIAGNGDIESGIKLAETIGIREQVDFTGWVSGSRKTSLFQSAQIFCLPSYAEGFPMAVLDAWAYGLPVITTPVGGIPEILIDGKNGFLFEPGNIERLSELLKLLMGNEQLRQSISEESIKLSNTTFNINNIAKQLTNIYDDLTLYK